MMDRACTAEPLAPSAEDAAALVEAAGAHGVYVANALAAGEGEGLVLREAGLLSALAWFGPRGNVVVLGPAAPSRALVHACVRAILGHGMPWRIVMGPAVIVDAVSQSAPTRVLVLRDQVYYEATAGDVRSELVDADVRAAQRGDRERLARATLQLNHSDLRIDPSRVDRRWLYDTIDERIADGTCRVLGEVGAVTCKLDVGSQGPGGVILEGVFTFQEYRGRQLASRLVASCIAAQPGRVCLHVGRHNAPARAAYERAGMRQSDSCRLLLLG
jgi:predicted GNAT family acetyltransferase